MQFLRSLPIVLVLASALGCSSVEDEGNDIEQLQQSMTTGSVTSTHDQTIDQALPFGPAPSGGSAPYQTDPLKQGVCALTEVSSTNGFFTVLTQAIITVGSDGFYHLIVRGSASLDLTASWVCASFASDFNNIDVTTPGSVTMKEYTFATPSSPFGTYISPVIGTLTDHCYYAGFKGDLSDAHGTSHGLIVDAFGDEPTPNSDPGWKFKLSTASSRIEARAWCVSEPVSTHTYSYVYYKQPNPYSSLPIWLRHTGTGLCNVTWVDVPYQSNGAGSAFSKVEIAYRSDFKPGNWWRNGNSQCVNW